MIPCMCVKKIIASHCFDVTSVLTKGIIITFCLVDDGNNDCDHGKVTKDI